MLMLLISKQRWFAYALTLISLHVSLISFSHSLSLAQLSLEIACPPISHNRIDLIQRAQPSEREWEDEEVSKEEKRGQGSKSFLHSFLGNFISNKAVIFF